MEVSEEQRRRIEANRAAALAKRNAKLQCPVSDSSNCVRLPMQHRSWAPLQSDVTGKNWHFRPCPEQANLCRSVNKENHAHDVSGFPKKQLLNGCGTASERVKVALEICAPDRFFLALKSGSVLQGFFESISSVARCENLEPSAQWPVYNLKDYEKVTAALKGLPAVEYEIIPWSTRMVLEKFQRAAECGLPYGPDHITDLEADQLLLNLPPSLAKTLLPFQREGVKYGLQRGGRCLLADEMGVGKTIQAIAMASCYREEGSLLVVCPASMRLVWAEELERWLPYLSPLDVHLVFGRKNNVAENMQLPKVVVISFNMLARLRESMSSRKWGMVIVDEAHNLRCTTKKLECDETMAVLELVQNVKRVVLLTGTPSLSRPFDIFNQINCLWPKLLGKNKYEFAKVYCDRQWSSFGQGNCKDFSRGSRLLELNILLKQAVMIRRMKDDVMLQLPPKRRQIICLQLSPADIKEAKEFTDATAREKISEQLGEEACKCGFTRKGACECEDEDGGDSNDESENDSRTASKTSARMLTEQEIGVAKLRGFQEWLLNNSIFAGREPQDGPAQKKMIIFAHHLKVLNSVQAIIQSKGVEFVRIDGSTLSRDRVNNVNRFRSDPEVKLAIIGVQAGGVGLDFSAAQSVVFVELPKSASEMLQAEDRAHRRGQKNSVNIYIFVAKGTNDFRHWQSLSKSLERVSTMTDGAEASLEIDRVVDSSNTHLQASLSQDSCITTESCSGSPNLGDQAPPCENELRLSNSQFRDTSDGSVENFPATSLMFEVSSNTGRIHLFLRSNDENAGPISLQANFKPEDLAHFAESGICERGALPTCLALNASHREAAAMFWEEYSNMRPVIRKKLRGRPLSLPLSAELNSFQDVDQYIAGGLVKGGSKRRWTPKEEVGCEIPAGASLRTVFYHTRNGLKETQIEQAWSAENVPLCKYCQEPCKGPRSDKPKLFDDLFCQVTCLNEYCIKTNRRQIREDLFELEGGVCVKCKLDCHALVERLKPLKAEPRRAYILEHAPQLTECKKLLERLIKNPGEGNAWHADHIVAVADGGGECSMENFQTLCIACHAKVTAEQHRRRKNENDKLKKNLQKTIKRQGERKKRRRTISSEGEPGVDYMDSSEDEADQELLNIEVAGSAYSTFGVTEVLTDQACKPILQPPGTEGAESTFNARSPEVKGIGEVLTERAGTSILQPPTEDDQDLLNIEVAGSSYSAFGVTEVLADQACKPILQEGRESTYYARSSPEVKDISEVLTERAGTSILQPPSEDVQDHLNINVVGSSYSASGVTEVLTDQACKPILQEGLESTDNARSLEVKDISEVLTERPGTSILQPPSEDEEDLLNIKVAGSSYLAFGISDICEVLTEANVMQLECHECSPDVRCSPEGRGSTDVLTDHASKLISMQPSGSDSNESTRFFKRSPYFVPSSGKKPTFSLQSFDKYLMGSV